ncbi:DNA-binding SARP family transcriptional activator/tetratricopeptide (TPR) repeat protein [Allocatelliglobosispora scoriae]|uniref:DNA-binding SARP family transcriptional activator/tetratricopeptide (TPR) repeat protein n=1 Tax=Allocatelliglobosispora scoriae TaxID=643052 RepID=A0A841BHK7_9ACTN|nr:BTAD domain-containing putative transcriptional regulator [Allocatelliglobosispora scoriae]MBB5866808.1 DNA-binding SARP family transcriptional activator/tetratricopeptide (TPR) repeat protein [Allocatelliglobosispora scoriae]
MIDSDGCNFRVLGPVEVVANGKPLQFARRQQLDLIAFLMLRADRVVGTAEIIEAMWGGAAPRTANVQVQNMVSALRAVLHHDGDEPLARVDRQAAGYALHVSSGRLDLAVFTALVAQARSARTPGAAVGLLREALGLWRGTLPLAGVRAPFATAARAYLSEQRDGALEQLFDAELRCGNHAAIVPALTDAVAANPVRQRFVAQLMVALHRSGRITDALSAYRSARQTLHGEYGLDAGHELQDLERRILLGDRTLDPPVEPDPAGPGSTRPPPPITIPVPAQLPLDVRGFAGRGTELAHLDALAPDSDAASTAATVVAVVMGTAGVGKTALAVHWAQQAANRFPDGQLYVNLRGFHPGARPVEPGEALRGFLDAFGVPPERVPAGLDAQAALYRSLVAGRRVLVLLDNAVDEEQVRPLLPGGRGGMVLITSRDQLIGLVALEGAHPVSLDVLSGTEAREFLVGRLGAQRVAADPQAADTIAVQCARLPLALAMVAARAAVHPTFPLGSLSAELSAVRERLRPQGANDFTTDVQAAFSWSYRRLTPSVSALFRLLGLHPGQDMGVDAAASLAGVAADEVRPLLAELVRAHLITEHVPGRFALHDLLRAYAAELAQRTESAPDQHAALRRLLSHYLHSAYAAAVLMYPHRYKLDLVPPDRGAVVAESADAEQASAWFAAEHAVLLAALSRAADSDLGTYAWQLASALSTFLDRSGHWHDWVASQRTALSVVERVADRIGQAHAHGSLGLAYNRLKRYDEAHVHLRRADDLFGELDDLVGQAYTSLRMSLVHEGQGDQGAALLDAEQALDRFESADHDIGRGQALNSVGWLHAQLGQYSDAVKYCEQAVDVHRELADREGLANALDSLGFALASDGDHRQAVVHYREALVVLRQLADPYYETITLAHLGDAHHAAGDHRAAADAWRQALAMLDELGHPDAADLRAKLAGLV